MASRSTVLGVDIGSYAMKVVWAARRGGRMSIERTEQLRLTAGTDNRRVIEQWLDRLGVARQPCVVGLAGRQCMFQPLLLTPDDPRTDEQVASTEVLRFNDMADQAMSYAYAPFELNPGQRRLLLALARPNVIEEAIAYTRSLGLNVVDLVPCPVAAFNALQQPETGPERPCIYANVGDAGTELAVGTGRGLMFSRTFSSGGRMFTDALAQTAGLSASQAENAKLTGTGVSGGDAGGGPPPDPTAAALNPVADVWCSELESCLSVYSSLYADAGYRPARMILAGGASRLKGFPEYIAARLGLPVERASALEARAGDAEPDVFAVATGLAAAALDAARVRVSLLPADLRDELAFRAQKPYWIAAAATAALAFGVSLGGGYHMGKRMEAHLNARRKNLRERQELVADIETVRLRDEQIRAMAVPLKEMMQGAPLMRDLLSLLAESVAPGDRVSLISDLASYDLAESPFAAATESNTVRDPRRRRRRAEPPPEAVTTFRDVVIEGYTRTESLLTVRELVESLRESEFVESADHLFDDRRAQIQDDSAATRVRQAKRFLIHVRLKAI